LYTIMCDVVAGALDKLRELKGREGKQIAETEKLK
jgi:hypothetical protein